MDAHARENAGDNRPRPGLRGVQAVTLARHTGIGLELVLGQLPYGRVSTSML